MKETTKKSVNVLGFITKYAMVIALVVVFALFAILTDGRLLNASNMSNLMLQNGYVLVMACGMLLCILTGGNIDLSVGSVICMVGGIAAVLISNVGMNPYLTIVISLVIGLLVGIWQGYWIGYVRIPPFITTLGGMFIFRGIGRIILDNRTVSIQDSRFLDIFTAYIKIPGLDDGEAIMQSWADNGLTVPGANRAALEAVTTGEKGILIAGVDYNAYSSMAKGEPLKIYYPASGTVVNPRPAMILKTAPNMDNAKAFVDFLFSD